jgi:hypothetical protein
MTAYVAACLTQSAMRQRTSSTCQNPRLFLDHGADETPASRLHIRECGVTFESPWEFPMMSELTICLAWYRPRFGNQRTPVEGTVVDSRRLGSRRFETTVFFSEMPEECRMGMRELARLAG